jgi:hypothetical protein
MQQREREREREREALGNGALLYMWRKLKRMGRKKRCIERHIFTGICGFQTFVLQLYC